MNVTAPGVNGQLLHNHFVGINEMAQPSSSQADLDDRRTFADLGGTMSENFRKIYGIGRARSRLKNSPSEIRGENEL